MFCVSVCLLLGGPQREKTISSVFANYKGTDLQVCSVPLLLAYWKVSNLNLLQAYFQFSNLSL